ncbi:hypothetical protein [Corynebacterium variabile]|nr:hypothetical protein [Corynebacterium variabile]
MATVITSDNQEPVAAPVPTTPARRREERRVLAGTLVGTTIE